MRKMSAVIHYEYKMQFKRPATWGILLMVAIFSLLDNYPSAGNLARLEFLYEPAYFVYRTMSQSGFVLMFGLIFLLAERIPMDDKTGMKFVLMSHGLEKWQYVFGKLLGGFLYVFSVLCIFLALNTAVYFFGVPFPVSLFSCLVPLVKAIIVSAVPASLFVSVGSVALPGMVDIRLFYLVAAILFGMNAACVGSADKGPFYLITSGDLTRLLWVHPKWSFADTESIFANGAFLVGSSLVLGSFPNILFVVLVYAAGDSLYRGACCDFGLRYCVADSALNARSA